MMRAIAIFAMILSLIVVNPETSVGFEADDIAVYEAFMHHFHRMSEVSYGEGFKTILLREKTDTGYSPLDVAWQESTQEASRYSGSLP